MKRARPRGKSKTKDGGKFKKGEKGYYYGQAVRI